MVHRVEEPARVEVAEQEIGRRDVGETGGTIHEAGLAAEEILVGLDHLAQMVADQQIIVQCQNDLRLGQDFLDVAERFQAEIDVVMEVHDVRLQVTQQRLELTRKFRVRVGELEPVEAGRAVDILVVVERLRDSLTQSAIGLLSRAAQKRGGIAGRALQPAEHLVGGDLRSSL